MARFRTVSAPGGQPGGRGRICLRPGSELPPRGRAWRPVAPGAPVQPHVLDLGFGASERGRTPGGEPPRSPRAPGTKPRERGPSVEARAPRARPPARGGERTLPYPSKPTWLVAADPVHRRFLQERGAGCSKPKSYRQPCLPGTPPASGGCLKDGNPTARGFKRP